MSCLLRRSILLKSMSNCNTRSSLRELSNIVANFHLFRLRAKSAEISNLSSRSIQIFLASLFSRNKCQDSSHCYDRSRSSFNIIKTITNDSRRSLPLKILKEVLLSHLRSSTLMLAAIHCVRNSENEEIFKLKLSKIKV